MLIICFKTSTPVCPIQYN